MWVIEVGRQVRRASWNIPSEFRLIEHISYPYIAHTAALCPGSILSVRQENPFCSVLYILFQYLHFQH